MSRNTQLLMPEELHQAEENEEIEGRVDDAGFEIHRREQGGEVKQGYQFAKQLILPVATFPKQHPDRENTHDGVGQPGGEFPYPKDRHTQGLQPEKQRRLFPERLEIDLNLQKIARREHFAGSLGKVDFVPVKQRWLAQKARKTGSSQQQQQVPGLGGKSHGLKGKGLKEICRKILLPTQPEPGTFACGLRRAIFRGK